MPQKYVAAASITVISWCLFSFLAPLTLSVIAFVYPTIQTIRALDAKEQQERWLTYWVVYGAFNVFESVGDVVLSWLPFYFTIKATFLVRRSFLTGNYSQLALVHGTNRSEWLVCHFQHVVDSLLQQAQGATGEIGEAT